MSVKKYKPDWEPKGGPDMGLTGEPVKMDKEETDFQERFKRRVVSEK